MKAKWMHTNNSHSLPRLSAANIRVDRRISFIDAKFQVWFCKALQLGGELG